MVRHVTAVTDSIIPTAQRKLHFSASDSVMV